MGKIKLQKIAGYLLLNIPLKLLKILGTFACPKGYFTENSRCMPLRCIILNPNLFLFSPPQRNFSGTLISI